MPVLLLCLLVGSGILCQIIDKLLKSKIYSDYIQFKNDSVLTPKETSWFGYYPDGAFKPVIPPQQTSLYTEDCIGLKAMDDAGKVKYIAVEGGHQEISVDDMKKYLVPYLTGQAPGSEKDDDHVGVGAQRAARNINRKKIYNANQTP